MLRKTYADSCVLAINWDYLIHRHARTDTHARAQPDPVEILLAKRGTAGAVSFERHHVLNAAPFQTVCEHLGTRPL